MFDLENQKQLNEQHAKTPKVGDYWSDHFVPVCVVLEVGKVGITLCRKTKDTDENHWTWDLDELELMTRNDFDKWLQYGGSTSGYWAWVNPEAHKDVVEYFKEYVS